MHTAPPTINKFYWGRALSVLSCLWIACISVSDVFASEQVAVGKTTLVIGKAYIVKDGKKVRLKSAQAIYDDRQIVTSSNGYVHIRFDDQGLVSVRPNSHLNIEKYHYNSTDPSASTVKFSLVRGSARSVSGKAAKSARKRFRMNTPLAAIGVRGTDFVVRADQQNIQAIVNEGAIVVTPFSDQCSISTLGPCSGFNTVVLQGDTKQLLQFNPLLKTPELLPASDAILRNQLESEIEDSESTADNKANYVLYNERQANKSLANGSVTKQVEISTATVVTIVDFTPPAIVDAPDLTARQLVWGRWADPLATDKILLSYTDASEERRVTVGNYQYALFRQGLGSQQVKTGLGAVSFELNSAQADLVVNGTHSAMQVNGGFLNINFNNNSFDTNLTLHHNNTGQINVAGSGKVIDGGFFNSRGPTQQISGSVSLDGSEAGYLFEQQLGNGKVEGVTLWDAQK